jgi:thioredoxin-like negative regulator of GroEL
MGVSDTTFKYPHVTFVKVDTERLPEVAQKYNVTAMPTFHFIKEKKVVETVLSIDKEVIRAAIARHASSSGSSGASTSSTAETSEVCTYNYLDSPEGHVFLILRIGFFA